MILQYVFMCPMCGKVEIEKVDYPSSAMLPQPWHLHKGSRVIMELLREIPITDLEEDDALR